MDDAVRGWFLPGVVWWEFKCCSGLLFVLVKFCFLSFWGEARTSELRILNSFIKCLEYVKEKSMEVSFKMYIWGIIHFLSFILQYIQWSTYQDKYFLRCTATEPALLIPLLSSLPRRKSPLPVCVYKIPSRDFKESLFKHWEPAIRLKWCMWHPLASTQTMPDI